MLGEILGGVSSRRSAPVRQSCKVIFPRRAASATTPAAGAAAQAVQSGSAPASGTAAPTGSPFARQNWTAGGRF